MKNLLTAVLPALALFALGGCAGTSAIASTEDDGVYYSSKDHTTAIVSASPATASTAEEASNAEEAANPDYHGNTASSSAQTGSDRTSSNRAGSDQYYDNSYTYMRGVPGYGLSSYAPYSPYTSLDYGYGNYGWGGGACGYSPYGYGFADPFYNPFYSPFSYGYSSGISISFGYARPFGYGYGGYGYGRPYGYGYGSGFYDPYYYGGSLYGGYYGRSAYYGNSYYGGNYYRGNTYNSNNSYSGNDRNVRATTSGHRTDRSSDGRYSSGGVSPSGATTSVPTGGSRARSGDGIVAPNPQTQPLPGVSGDGGRRVRPEAVTTSPDTRPTRTDESFNRPRRMSRYAEQLSSGQQSPDVNPGQNQVVREENLSRRRTTEVAFPEGQPQPTAAPQPEQRRRGGFFQNTFPQPSTVGGQAADQPTRQRSYDQPRPQRTYEQPQQQTYEQPQRSSSQPSYSAPSYNSGGGNSGGGGSSGHSRSRSN